MAGGLLADGWFWGYGDLLLGPAAQRLGVRAFSHYVLTLERRGALRSLQDRDFTGTFPRVSLCSTRGYELASLQDAKWNPSGREMGSFGM